MIRILGAILTGGKSRRFGSDKLLAKVDGLALIDHVVARLTGQVSDIVLLGQCYSNLVTLPDRPTSGFGPLGGLNAALHHAAEYGFDAVLMVPGDAPDLPLNLAECLSPMPAFVAGSPVTGFWPKHLAPILDAWLAAGNQYAVAAFCDHVGANAIHFVQPMANINTPQDHDNFCRG